jgi:hypothetical protein
MANSILYGFWNLKDVLSNRVIEIEEGPLNQAVALSIEQYNREINQMLGLFAMPVEFYQRRFRVASNGRLQAADQNSRPLPTKGTTYDTAFPLQMGQAAWGTNFVTAAKRTVRDINNDVSNMLIQDRNWLGDHVVAGLVYNASGWTFTDDEHGSLTIKGLANADTVTYSVAGGAPATDNHYLAQAAAIADASNPFPTIYSELIEHTENGGTDAEIYTFIAPSLTATATVLACSWTCPTRTCRSPARPTAPSAFPAGRSPAACSAARRASGSSSGRASPPGTWSAWPRARASNRRWRCGRTPSRSCAGSARSRSKASSRSRNTSTSAGRGSVRGTASRPSSPGSAMVPTRSPRTTAARCGNPGPATRPTPAYGVFLMATRDSVITRSAIAMARIERAIGSPLPRPKGGAEYQRAAQLEFLAERLERQANVAAPAAAAATAGAGAGRG